MLNFLKPRFTPDQCRLCLMPKDYDDGMREREDYCSYCYKNGKVCFEGTREEFQDMVYKKMRGRGISHIKAKFFTWMIRFAPYWQENNKVKNTKNKNTKIKIGVDIDDILVDCNRAVLEYYNKLNGTTHQYQDINTHTLRDFLKISRQQERQLRNDFHINEEDILLPIEGALEGLLILKDYELIAISTRPYHIRTQTEKTLAKYFPEIFNNIPIHLLGSPDPNYVRPTKGEFAKGLGISIFIDDMFPNAETLAEHDIDVVLLDKPWNQSDKIIHKIHRVYNWKEIVDKVIELSEKYK